MTRSAAAVTVRTLRPGDRFVCPFTGRVREVVALEPPRVYGGHVEGDQMVVVRTLGGKVLLWPDRLVEVEVVA